MEGTLTTMQANITRTNHIMWTMGTDFKYQYAHTWYRNMDKLIHYVNKVTFSQEECEILFPRNTWGLFGSEKNFFCFYFPLLFLFQFCLLGRPIFFNMFLVFKKLVENIENNLFFPLFSILNL